MVKAEDVIKAAEAGDAFMNRLLDGHQARVEKAIQELERRIITLMKRIDTDENGKILGPRYTLKQAQEIHAKMLVEFEQTFGVAAQRVVNDLSVVKDFIDKNLAHLEIDPGYGRTGDALIKSLRDEEFRRFKNITQQAQEQLAQGIYNAVATGEDYGELIGQVRAALVGAKNAHGRPMTQYADLFVHDCLMNYYRTATNIKADRAKLDHRLYYGNVIATSRPFCIARVGRTFSAEEIKGWTHRWKGKSGPAMQYCGGYNCRHHWMPVKKKWLPDGVAKMQSYWEEQGGLPPEILKNVNRERRIIGIPPVKADGADYTTFSDNREKPKRNVPEKKVKAFEAKVAKRFGIDDVDFEGDVAIANYVKNSLIEAEKMGYKMPKRIKVNRKLYLNRGEPKSYTAVGSYSPRDDTLHLNPNSRYWDDPHGIQAELYESGWASANHKYNLVLHELSHKAHVDADPGLFKAIRKKKLMNEERGIILVHVGRYAATNPMEAVAEIMVGLKTGKKYNPEVMKIFEKYARELMQ